MARGDGKIITTWRAELLDGTFCEVPIRMMPDLSTFRAMLGDAGDYVEATSITELKSKALEKLSEGMDLKWEMFILTNGMETHPRLIGIAKRSDGCEVWRSATMGDGYACPQYREHEKMFQRWWRTDTQRRVPYTKERMQKLLQLAKLIEDVHEKAKELCTMKGGKLPLDTVELPKKLL
jgi:hypothetical protein